MHSAGYSIITISRDNSRTSKLFPFADQHLSWHETDSLVSALSRSTAVINLAGAGVGDKKWSESYKNEILNSRIESTQLIADLIRVSSSKTSLINASAIGYYGNRGDEILTETDENGNGFLAQVVTQWEKSANSIAEITRVVTLRIGVVLSRDGGALKKILLPFKFFIGGPLGAGKQWLSWIHIDDLTDAVKFIIENVSLKGPVNLTSQDPIQMNDFAKTIGEIMHKPSFFRVPRFVLRLALGESEQMVTYSQRVIPEKLIQSGFLFKFNNIHSALEDILK